VRWPRVKGIDRSRHRPPLTPARQRLGLGLSLSAALLQDPFDPAVASPITGVIPLADDLPVAEHGDRRNLIALSVAIAYSGSGAPP
jgi:hypothetical protein